MVAMPVPLNGTTNEEFGVLLINVMLPENVPAEAGANPTLNAEEPPGGTESGMANPDEVKPVPAREACVTLRVAVPGLRMVSVWVLATPTVTLPKLTLDGMTEICGWTPAPLREIVAGELVAVLTTVILPAAAPATVGAKFAVSASV